MTSNFIQRQQVLDYGCTLTKNMNLLTIAPLSSRQQAASAQTQLRKCGKLCMLLKAIVFDTQRYAMLWSRACLSVCPFCLSQADVYQNG